MPTEIVTIEQFKQVIATVMVDISRSCARCAYPDCQGYPWILPDEETDLLAAGLRLVQLNGLQGPIYLDTFGRDDAGALVVGRGGALCPYRDDEGRCSVHATRPLTCHLYPLSMEIRDGDVVWAIHTDCEFVQHHQREATLDRLLHDCREVIASLSPALRDALHTTMSRVAAVSRPISMDCYTVLGPVRG